VQRSGGTTISSAAALRKWALERYVELLKTGADLGCGRIIVNGDLTDVYDILLADGLDILVATREFLEERPAVQELVWGLGNHDLSKDSSKLGIVAFLGAILSGWFPQRFRLVRSPEMVDIDDGIYMIPHVVNQEQFDLALSRVPDNVKYLLLHCNYDNTFAGAMDHSLNISREQVRKFRDRGMRVVLGHEHQHRTLMNGNLIIVGNQFPTSVADCLSHGDAQKDGKKYALLIDGERAEHVQTWSRDDSDGWFAEVDWQELSEVFEDGRGFIRVIGEATATQAADVVKAIAAFRQRSQSFVVTNAVKVEGLETGGEELTTQEDIRQIDVIGLLIEMLDDERQKETIRRLTGRAAAQQEVEDAAA
jgi:hypothetical protein